MFQCNVCPGGQVQDTILTLQGQGPGQLGGTHLIVEIERSNGGQIARNPIIFGQGNNSPLQEPVFVIAQQPGHWLCFSRHRTTNAWYRLNDSAVPVLGDPFTTQGGNCLINFMVFSLN